MKNKFTFILLTACFILIQIGTVKAEEMKPADIYTLFVQYGKEYDIEKLGTLFDENALYIPGQGKAPVKGRAAIQQLLETYLGVIGSTEIMSSSIHQNGDLAFAKTVWRIKAQEGFITGTATEVLKKTAEGKWVFVFDSPYGE